jgi:uncharacterized membrane protein YoaK (UPF0700 family)
VSVSSILAEIRELLFPPKGSSVGPVGPLLVALTFVTGLVDAFSYLVLGHVFVANMTGNVLFLAFALAGVHGLSALASLVALGSFVLGAAAGGKIHSLMSQHRGKLLAASSFVQAGLVFVAFVLTLLHHPSPLGDLRYVLIIVLAVAMGVQNAASRKLAVPDLTTTVLTLTLTGIGADAVAVGGSGSRATRRMVSVVTMFLGAFIGALLVLKVAVYYPLLIAFVAVASVGLASYRFTLTNPQWH